MLCEQWPNMTEGFEMCFVIFGIPEGTARTRWGKFVIATETGPRPFTPVE